MSDEWAKVEITATTKQTKSAAQVEAEWRAQQFAEINARADASLARMNAANAAFDNGAVGNLKKALGWETTKEKGATLDTGTRSVLDTVPKSVSPILGSAEERLRSLAGGGFITNFSGVSVGNVPINAEVGKSLANMLPGNLATTTDLLQAGKITEVPGMVLGGISDLAGKSKNLFNGGMSQLGVFNPAGVALETETDPSGASYVKLAKTVFTSGTTVEALPVDIYDNIIHSPQNKVKSILSDVLGAANRSFLGSLKNTLLNAADKSQLASNLTGSLNLNTAKGVLDKYKNSLLSGVPLTKEGMLKDVYEAVGYDGKSLSFKGGLQGVGENMLNDIKKNFESETGILSMYKDVKKVLDGDSDTAATLFKIVGNFTDNARFAQLVGLGEQLDIITNVSKALVEMGAVNFLDDVIEKIDHKDRDKFISQNLESGIATGNVEFLQWALKHTSGAKILAAYPNAISSIVSSYNPSVDEGGNVSKKAYTDLVDVLGKIDHEWDIVGTRKEGKIYDYAVFSSFNRQAKLAILAGGNRQHISALISAENFGGTFDTALHLQVRYPDYPIV